MHWWNKSTLKMAQRGLEVTWENEKKKKGQWEEGDALRRKQKAEAEASKPMVLLGFIKPSFTGLVSDLNKRPNQSQSAFRPQNNR